VESLYQQFGGRISLIIKDGAGHHPHSLRDPKPIVDFITQSVREVPTAIPAYVGQKVSRTVLYGLDTIFRDVPGEGLHISYRGAAFVECFDRLVFELPGVEGQVTVIAPKSPASGTPWVLRSAFVTRDDVVDLALLAQGYHIVTGPVPYNADGPQRPSWDAVYQHLTANGFSAKLVVEGVGAGAGDEIAWAAENPDKVSGIYLENALLLRSHMSHAPVLDQLAPLAQAHIVMLGFYGNCPPEIAANATLASTTYQALGGQMTVITQEGAGQAPTLPTDAKPLVDVITHRMK
jgi:hypothetical protein